MSTPRSNPLLAGVDTLQRKGFEPLRTCVGSRYAGSGRSEGGNSQEGELIENVSGAQVLGRLSHCPVGNWGM